jgi:hypothetical protein
MGTSRGQRNDRPATATYRAPSCQRARCEGVLCRLRVGLKPTSNSANAPHAPAAGAPFSRGWPRLQEIQNEPVAFKTAKKQAAGAPMRLNLSNARGAIATTICHRCLPRSALLEHPCVWTYAFDAATISRLAASSTFERGGGRPVRRR